MRHLAFPLVFALISAGSLSAQSDVPDLSRAFKAGESGDWLVAAALAQGEVARDLVEWMRLRDETGTFAEAAAFLKKRADWPGMDPVQAYAEAQMPQDLAPSGVLAFFDGRAPQTGAGVIRLAEALRVSGQGGEADALVIQAWLTQPFDEEGQRALMARYPLLLADYHAARADMLLWRARTSDAERLLPLLSAGQQALTRARIALIRDEGNIDGLIAAVPEGMRDAAGLAYDRYSWRARRGRNEDAIELLEARSTSAEALGEPSRWAGWRQTLARWAMREGDPAQAYRLAASHFLTEGSAFADLEWLAGYIALTHLNQPGAALRHFETMAEAVDTPISLSRGYYWVGRAQEALGDARAAQVAYRRGAEHQTAFYGLLAAEKLGIALDLSLTGLADVTDEGIDLLADDLTAAGLLLLKAGERGRAVLFFAQMGARLDAPALALLGRQLEADNETFFKVLLGKAAAERGIILPTLYFPMHDLAKLDLPVDPALALSIARRESEFRTDAGSGAGALGLMQLMPATAEEVAKELGLPFSRGRLTSDWSYNAALGARYLANLQERFGPSPVMIAAGYNAGPSRPRSWIGERGDPRRGDVDVVDWIEHIPFSETRNYVMRVAESLPVYEARLSGVTGRVAFTDLLIGRQSVARPQARPGSLPEMPVLPAVTEGLSTSSPPAAVPVGLRPVARPGTTS